MEYVELEVPPALRRHLLCVWRLRDAARSRDVQTIYPDGRCELIVHLAAPPRLCELDRDWRVQAHTLFAAQQRAPIRLAWDGAIDCLGVRLRPAASAAVVAQPARLRDRIVDLASVDPVWAPAFAAAVQHYVTSPDDGELWRLLEARLLPYAIDPRIEAAVSYLEAQAGRGRVEQAAELAAMSLRSLQAKFLACVGLGAKEFARMLRLQATLRALDQSAEPLSQVALDAGFADQAHATRELARLTGATPARLRAALQSHREGDDTLRMAAAFVRGQA